MTAYAYDPSFLDYTSRSNRASAQAIVPLVQRIVPIASVVDFGCARGSWLSTWQRAGVADICGVDGDYVLRGGMEIDQQQFVPADLAQPVRLGRHFDLAQSLEVAEHVPASSAAIFVDSLCSHAKVVLFSAAPPGQGGEHHVNEQPYAYWRDLFKEQGFAVFDCVRPALRGRPEVQAWYRYNTFLYVHMTRVGELPADIARTRIGDGQALADISPPAYKLRKALVRRLPQALALSLAKVKARVAGK